MAKQIIVGLEGNIGAGKTTVLDEIIRHHNNDVDCVYENLKSWCNIPSAKYSNKTYNALENMYSNPRKYFVTFQALVNSMRTRDIFNVLNNDNCRRILLSERDAFSGLNFFAPLQESYGNLTDYDASILTSILDNMVDIFPKATADLLIYLRATPNLCQERLKKRNRPEESDIGISFLENLHSIHERVFDLCKESVTPIGDGFYKCNDLKKTFYVIDVSADDEPWAVSEIVYTACCKFAKMQRDI
jgi:deoxyadenosine/deoxycytidine kinase